MTRIYLCFALLCYSYTIFAQNYIGVAPWDNALSYNPSAVGVHTDQSIQMNIHLIENLRPLVDDAINTNPTRAEEFINFIDEIPSPLSINRSYFVGYQKTAPLGEKFRFTGALQLQGYHWKNNAIQDTNSAGITANIHYSIFAREASYAHLSLGYQYNFLFQTPNATASRESYDAFTAPTLSFDEYSEQFRNLGANQSLSLNYSYVRKNETLLSIGAIINGYKYRLAEEIDPSLSGIVNFKTTNLTLPRLNIEIQQAFHNKFVIEAHGIVGSESQVAAGLGIRVKEHNLLKLLVVSGIHPVRVGSGFGQYFSLNLSLEMKRYKFIASAGLSIIRFAKAGVVYRFENRDTSSLISLGN